MKAKDKSVAKIFISYHLPALLYGIGIFVLSSLSNLNTPDLGFDTQDKFYHLLLYAPFGYFLGLSLSNQNLFPELKRRYWLVAIIGGILYGISDEIHQYFVPGRFMSFWDTFANGLGVCLGGYLFHFRFRLLAVLSRSKRGLDRSGE